MSPKSVLNQDDREAPFGYVCGIGNIWRGVRLRRAVLFYIAVHAIFSICALLSSFNRDFVLLTGGYSSQGRFILHLLGVPAFCFCIYATVGVYDSTSFPLHVFTWFVLVRAALITWLFVVDINPLRGCGVRHGKNFLERHPAIAHVEHDMLCQIAYDMYIVKTVVFEVVLNAYMYFSTVKLMHIFKTPMYLISFNGDPMFDEKTPLVK